MDCIECGLCSYVCPAYRGLCCSIKQGKATLKAKQSNQVTRWVHLEGRANIRGTGD